jgi:hypothetical protein
MECSMAFRISTSDGQTLAEPRLRTVVNPKLRALRNVYAVAGCSGFASSSTASEAVLMSAHADQ